MRDRTRSAGPTRAPGPDQGGRRQVSAADGSGAVTRVRATAAAYAMAAAAAAAALAYLWIWGTRYGLDLRVYRDAVSSWRSGENPYLLVFTASRLSFTYPPFALLVLSPLAWPSFPVAQWLMWVASIAAATASVVLVLRDGGVAVTRRSWCGAFTWACASIIVLEPARSGADYGQIEFILMLVVVADLLLVRPRYRGILIGVGAAVKLTPLVFVIVLIVRRDVRSLLRVAVSFCACTALSWGLWPGLSRAYWLHDVIHPARVGTITYGGNQSWYAILHRPPFPVGGSVAGWLVLSLLTLAVGTFVAWRCVRAGREASAIIAVALAGLLISPISWNHHWIWALLIPPVIGFGRGAGVPRPVRALLWGLVVLTIAAPYWWFSHGAAADAFDAALPLWTAATLVVWGATDFASLRASPAPARDEVAPLQ